jgi:hypothetical protein
MSEKEKEEIKVIEQMLDRMKKFYKKFEKIQSLREKSDHNGLEAIAGGERILKYKKKIGIDFKEIKNISLRHNKSDEVVVTNSLK